MVKENDWRRQDQGRYMRGVVLKPCRIDLQGGDHEHCEFCSAKFSAEEGNLLNGYCTEDEYRWVCEDCFRDFQAEMSWVLSGSGH